MIVTLAWGLCLQSNLILYVVFMFLQQVYVTKVLFFVNVIGNAIFLYFFHCNFVFEGDVC